MRSRGFLGIFLLYFTCSARTILSLIFLHPSFFHEPRIDGTTNTISNNWFWPHKYNTKKTSKDSRIHRRDDKYTIGYIVLSGFKYSCDCYHLWSFHWCYILSKEKNTVENKCRKHDSNTPCESFLYCTNPYFCSFFEKESYNHSEDTESWREKNF